MVLSVRSYKTISGVIVFATQNMMLHLNLRFSFNIQKRTHEHFCYADSKKYRSKETVGKLLDFLVTICEIHNIASHIYENL